MVYFVRSLIGAAALLSAASAAPMPKPDDSAIGAEIPVSAPNGTPTSDPVPAATGGNYGSGGSGGYGGGYMASSSMMQESSMMMDSSSMMMESSSMMMESSSMMDEMSSTMSAENTYSTPSYSSSASYSMATYGSGSQSWGGSGYNDCVQQCAASYGSPPMSMSPSSTESGGSGGYSGSGNGATHTVIVAPSAGVLRYVPFSVNASVGDTVEFQWKAGPHTVTRSSALEVCNKTSTDPFASGPQNANFVFREMVNDTKPIWVYCGVDTHCQQGMFMGINIGQADPSGSSSSGSSGSSDYMPLSSMMSNLTAMGGDMMALWSYTKNQTGSNSYANGWGMGTNMAGMNQDAMMQTAENVMYMQTLIASNPDSMQDGKFVATANMKVPMDLKQALAASTGSGAAGANAGSSPSSSTSAPVSASPAPTGPASSGAGSIASSSVVVGLVAVVATFFAL